MSFSSAGRFLTEMGVTNETATDTQRKAALLVGINSNVRRARES